MTARGPPQGRGGKGRNGRGVRRFLQGYVIRTYVRMVPMVPFSVLVEYLFFHLYPTMYIIDARLFSGKLVRVLSFSNFRCICCRYCFW